MKSLGHGRVLSSCSIFLELTVFNYAHRLSLAKVLGFKDSNDTHEFRLICRKLLCSYKLIYCPQDVACALWCVISIQNTRFYLPWTVLWNILPSITVLKTIHFPICVLVGLYSILDVATVKYKIFKINELSG